MSHKIIFEKMPQVCDDALAIERHRHPHRHRHRHTHRQIQIQIQTQTHTHTHTQTNATLRFAPVWWDGLRCVDAVGLPRVKSWSLELGWG